MLKIRFLQKIKSSTIVLSCSALLITSCQTNPQGINLKPEEETSQKPQLKYSSLVLQKYSDYLIIPVGFDTKDRARKFSSSSYYENPFLITNLIFYHKFNDATHLLLNQTAIINQFEYLLPPGFPNQLKPLPSGQPQPNVPGTEQLEPEYLFYKIIPQDTNEDGTLNGNDAILGYLSDLSGKNLQQITPEKTQLQNWEYLPQQQLILLKIKRDSHKDEKFIFEKHDEILGYFYDLKTQKLQAISPENSQLLEWKLDKANDLIFLKIRKESNGDGKFSEQDEVNLLKLQISNPIPHKEMINEELKEQLTKKEIRLP